METVVLEGIPEPASDEPREPHDGGSRPNGDPAMNRRPEEAAVKERAKPTPERASELDKYSTRCTAGRALWAWTAGLHAGREGLPADAVPFPLTPKRDRHGVPRRDAEGRPITRPPTARRLRWLEGWEEGAALHDGSFFELLERRERAALRGPAGGACGDDDGGRQPRSTGAEGDSRDRL